MGKKLPGPAELAGVPGVLPGAPEDAARARPPRPPGRRTSCRASVSTRGLDQRAVHGRGILPKSICESKFRGLRATSSVGTLARGLDILELFAGESPELTQKEISERLGLPVPTVHRLTKLLIERGWLVRDPGSRRLRLGLGVARLLPALLSGLRLPELARDHLRGDGRAHRRDGEPGRAPRRRGGVPGERERQPPAHPALLDRPAAAGALHGARQVPAGPAARRTRRGGTAGREPYAALTPRTITTWDDAAGEPRARCAARRWRCRTRSTRWGSTRSPCRSPGSEGDGPGGGERVAAELAGRRLGRRRAHARAARGGGGDRGGAGIHGRAGAAA